MSTNLAGEQATKAHLGALPLSHAAAITAAGIEPATSRVSGEVTIIYATGQNLTHYAINHDPKNRSGNQ